MKKIIFNIILFFCFYKSYAQVTFGIQGGLGLSRQSYELYSNYEGDNTPYEKNPKYIPVPIIAGIADIPLNNTLSVRSGLGFRQQGYSFIDLNTQSNSLSLAGGFTHAVLEARINYLEVPLNISTKLPFNNKKFEILTGVTFATSIGGQGKFTQRSYSIGNALFGYDTPVDVTDVYYLKMVSGKTPYEPFNNGGTIRQSADHINRFNCTFNIGLGYKIDNKFIVNASMNYGLTNMSPDVSSSSYYERGNINSLSYSFTVAYMFECKKAE